MKYLWIFIFLTVIPNLAKSDAFQDGKLLVEGNPNLESFASTGIEASENPAEAQLTDSTKIKEAIASEQHTNEALLMVKKGNQEREQYTIEINNINLSENGMASEMGNAETDTYITNGTITKTCIKSGESYTMTCRRQRIIEIKVTPEVRANHPKYCLGHWNWSGTSKSHCGGCKGGDSYISQHKKVDITRDEWVGCEDLDRLHDQGQAEIVSETLGSPNEARVIDGESIKKDYWETTRTYGLNTNTIDTCEPLKALGCVQHDSVCEEYATGMAGVRLCKRFKMSYTCRASTETKVSNRSKLGLTLPPKQTAIANHNMVNALSQLEAMHQMAKHMEGGEANLRIFRGDSKRCSTNFGGSFKDCCKSVGGVGTRLHMATECTADEKQLAEAKAQKRCVFVGSKKKNQTLGMNVSKEYVYCCYPSKLGLAIQQGARTQLGKTFGTADQPSCEGLTPDELSSVDFSQLDLSETFADIAASAQKMSAEIKTDLAQKQRQFDKPTELASIKANQPNHKRVNEKGEAHEIVY